MEQKNYFYIVSLFFTLGGILHLLRIFYGWEAVIGGWMVPMWFSYVAVIVAGLLGYFGCKFARGK